MDIIFEFISQLGISFSIRQKVAPTRFTHFTTACIFDIFSKWILQSMCIFECLQTIIAKGFVDLKDFVTLKWT